MDMVEKKVWLDDDCDLISTWGGVDQNIYYEHFSENKQSKFFKNIL